MNSRAVMSRDVVMKHLRPKLAAEKNTISHSLRVRRPLNTQDLVMMSSVCPVKVEWGKLSDKMVWRPPHLHVRVMRYGNVPGRLCGEANEI